MEMTSTRNVPAPVATVWAALNDPAVLKGCIPGCDVIEPDGEDAARNLAAADAGLLAVGMGCGCSGRCTGEGIASLLQLAIARPAKKGV